MTRSTLILRGLAGGVLLTAVAAIAVMISAPPANSASPPSPSPSPQQAPTPPPVTTPRTVVATTGMVADMTRAMGGGDWQVRALMGPGVDPHLYKPLRDDVARLMAADLVVTSGLMLEGKMGEVLAKSSKDRPVIVIGDLLDSTRVIRPEGAESHPDPHIWMDLDLWASAAEGFGEKMAASEPSRAPEYRRRAAEYAAKCRALHEWGRTTIATIPESHRILITSHDAFAYFGRAYGLRVEGIQGISTDSEPGLRRINELVDLVVANKVPAVFVESSVPRKSIEALIEGAASRGHRLGIGGELYSDALGPEGTWEGTVVGMLDHNLTTVTRALGGTAPKGGSRGAP